MAGVMVYNFTDHGAANDVWCGYEYPKSLNGIDGNPCLGIWDDVMLEIYQKKSAGIVRSFDISNRVVKVKVCADSGKRLTEACRKDARGDRGVWCYFQSGTEPWDYCDCHVMVNYNIVTGGVACPLCPEENIEMVGMIRVTRNFPMQVYVTDAQYVWRSLPDNKPMSVDETLPFFANALPWGKYCGISRSKIQFNRGCAIHTGLDNYEDE